MDHDPTKRTLTLLSLLQTRSAWPAAELAARLGISRRTLRRDADRLRSLGYAVVARPGPGSTYRLAPSLAIPPLLFTADEVGVMVTGLRLAQAQLHDDAAASALAKLDQVLPPRLARRAGAADAATDVLDNGEPGADATTLGLVADAVAESGRLRFRYLDQHGRSSIRTLDPYRQLFHRGRWYLIGYDVGRADWRLFRLDRVSELERVPGHFRRREFPNTTVAGWLATDFGRAATPSRGSPGSA